jgi:hypothetical protein
MNTTLCHVSAISLLVLFGACAKQTRDVPQPDAGPSLPDKVAGMGCKRDDDCPKGRCAGALHISSADTTMDAPGGYCTMDCDTDSLCGATGECAVPSGESAGECLARCSAASDCRDGYLCIGGSTSVGFDVSGTCQPRPATGHVPDGVVGRACGTAVDCQGAECARTSPLGTDFSGNYCTARCLDDTACGAGGACLVNSGSSEAGYCYAHCSSDDDCTRDGYRCRHIGADFDACYPAERPLPDDTAGKACQSDGDCGGNKSSCAAELPFGDLTSNAIVAAAGGYCTQRCMYDADCGAQAQCIAAGVMGGYCLGSCSQQSDCRTGYSCVAHGRDFNNTDSVCVPLTSP